MHEEEACHNARDERGGERGGLALAPLGKPRLPHVACQGEPARRTLRNMAAAALSSMVWLRLIMVCAEGDKEPWEASAHSGDAVWRGTRSSHGALSP